MMPFMKQEDITHLANLARIRIEPEELQALEGELSSIVEYVSTVTDIAEEEGDSSQALGARFNVFRADEVTNKPNEFTEDALAEMPHTDGRYMLVKKILKTDG